MVFDSNVVSAIAAVAAAIGFGGGIIHGLVVGTRINKHEKHDFIRLRFEGSHFLMTPAEACQILQDDDDPKRYGVEAVRLTMAEFDAMPEFDGF
jgi:hypothetical protein